MDEESGAPPAPQDGQEPLTSYVPADIARRVRNRAKANKRSVSAEVWALIEEALKIEEARRAS